MEMTSIVSQINEADRNNGSNLAHTVRIHKGTTISSTQSEKVLYKDKRSYERNTKNSMKENCIYKVIFKKTVNSDTTVIINNKSRQRESINKRNFKRFARFNDLRNVGASSCSSLGDFIQPTLNNGNRFNRQATAQDTFNANNFIEKSFRK